MKNYKVLILTIFLSIFNINYSQDIEEDDPNTDMIADSIANLHLVESSPFIQDVTQDKLNTIGYNYIGVLHNITSSIIYVELNKNPKGIRAKDLISNTLIADIRIEQANPCLKFLFKAKVGTEVKLEVLKNDGITWQDLKTVSTAYEKVDVLEFTQPYFKSISKYYGNPEGITTHNFHSNYRRSNQSIFFESVIFQQNIGTALYSLDEIPKIQSYVNNGVSDLKTVFPYILPCDNDIYINLMSIEQFFNKYWTNNSFIKLGCDSSKMLDSLNNMYFNYYYNFEKCKKRKIESRGGYEPSNGQKAPCNCQRMANHSIEHGFGQSIEPNIFPHEFHFYHPTRNAHRWGSWDIDRKDGNFGTSGEKYGLGGTVGGLSNYLVLRSSGDCSPRTSRTFELGGTKNISNNMGSQPAYQYEQIVLGYFCERWSISLPEKCECEIPVTVRYKADVRFQVDAQKRSCFPRILHGAALSKAEGFNAMSFTHFDEWTSSFKKMDAAYTTDLASYKGGGFTLGGIPDALKDIATGIATIITSQSNANIISGIGSIATGLGTVLKNPPTITGGNHVFGSNKYSSMFDNTYNFLLVQNEPAYLRLDNHLKMRVEGEDGFYNWVHFQSEFALAYKWNAQKTYAIPGDPETYCCNDGIGGFIKSFTTDNSVQQYIYNDAVKTFFFNMNFSPKFSTTPQEGKGFRQFKENCINWVNKLSNGGHDVLFKSARVNLNQNSDYIQFTDSKINWNITDDLKGYSVKIYNISGQEIYNTYSIPQMKKQIFDFSSLNVGVYFVLLQNGNDVKSYKFSK